LGPRALTSAAAVAWWGVSSAAGLACGPALGVNGGTPTAPVSSARSPTEGGTALVDVGPTIDVDAESALGLEPGDGEVVVQTSALRAHPVGAHVGPIFQTWPGWGGTLHALSRDPVADFDWIDIVGPPDAARQRMLAHVGGGAGEAALEGRLVALQARSAEPAESHVAGRMPAAAARLDGLLRIVFRPQPGFVAATTAARGPALSSLLVRARVKAPVMDPLEAVRADVAHPHDVVRLLPESIRHIQARVFVLADGDAEGTADGDCDDPGQATVAASSLRDAIARQNFSLVRMLTHGLLDAIVVTADGPVVKIRLHATRDQLEAVLSLVSAMVPAAGP
jgi:hypothetical protein